MSNETIFAKGVNFYKPREGAPEFIKGNITINLKELLSFSNEQGIEEIIRFDLKKSDKTGGLYLTLNTWKPTKPQSLEKTPDKSSFKADISKTHYDEQGNEGAF